MQNGRRHNIINNESKNVLIGKLPKCVRSETFYIPKNQCVWWSYHHISKKHKCKIVHKICYNKNAYETPFGLEH